MDRRQFGLASKQSIFIIENDLLEAIIQLPNNLFYNTGITTYIWLLASHKAEQRKGRVQLIDASQLYRKLRKNLGDKNCEFAPEHVQQIVALHAAMPDEGISKVFDNRDFGHYKVTIERPSRKAAQFTPERVAGIRFIPAIAEPMAWAFERWGADLYDNLPERRALIEDHLEREDRLHSPRSTSSKLALGQAARPPKPPRESMRDSQAAAPLWRCPTGDAWV